MATPEVMNLGDYRVEVVPDTEFRLDGGAMFGVVPRVLWERDSPPDPSNRVRLNTNCLFIETPHDRILIDTGIGEKWTNKEVRIYGIHRSSPFCQTLLERTGSTAEAISIVVNTHLHFDHAGGNTIIDGGNIVPQFPNARYFVSANEFEHAERPHERDRASYRPENWQPLVDSGQLELKPDDYEVVEGLQMRTIRGHSKTMQTWRLDRGGQTMYGFADLIPTRHHLPLPWIMGYDLYPRDTLEFKKRILPEAVEEGWICLFYHDPDLPYGRLANVNNKIVAETANKFL